MSSERTQQGTPIEGPHKRISADQEGTKKLFSWGYLFALSVGAIYAYVFLNWLFDVTKPSFMDRMAFGHKLDVFLLSGLAFAAAALVCILALGALSLIPGLSRAWKAFLLLGGVIPASFIAATILTLIDNFTYTVFQFGILTSDGAVRGVYGALFSLIWIGCMVWVTRRLNRHARRKRVSSARKWQLAGSATVLLLSAFMGGGLYQADAPVAQASSAVGTADKHPNILLIGTDGLDADHTSLYNPATDTTPFLKSFAQETLMAENDFSNANETAGSLASLFTGKLPTTTRMLYPPDILKGADAFQHLPAILKDQGYYNAEISVDYYADMNNLNLQNSFVTVNGRSSTLGNLYMLTRQVIPEDAAYFLSSTAKGFSDRLMQSYYIQTVENPYTEVTMPMVDMNDQHRVDQLMNLFQSVHQPLFVHVHMMGTHLSDWKEYDPAIREYDSFMQQVIADLKQIGQLENTVIIVYTDHGFQDAPNMRLPLLFRFPNEQYVGQITHNTQNLDIAPTVLDYLGIEPPSWMAGQSLLQGEPSAARPIFSAAPNYQTGNSHNQLQLDLSKIKPPFYQFGTINVIVCQNWYALDTAHLTWSHGTIAGYSTPCAADSLPSLSQAQQLILNRLKADGFDTTMLEPVVGERQAGGQN